MTKTPASSLSDPDKALFLAVGSKDGESALKDALAALKAGANPNAAQKSPYTMEAKLPLELAAELNEPWAAELAIALLDAGANPVFDEDGRCALHLAARFGHPNTVQALLDKGHSARAATVKGWTPFLCAAMSGRLELCQTLAPLSNVNARVKDPFQEFDAAGAFMQARNPEAALTAYQLGWGDPGVIGAFQRLPLHSALKEGWDELALYLTGYAGPLADHRDEGQDSLLHQAASSGNEACLRALVASGHSVNALNNNGVTPLVFAFSEGNLGCARALLELGADPALRGEPVDVDENGQAMDALCAATLSPEPEALALALGFAERCDRNLTFSVNRCTALHLAARNASPAMGERWTRALLSLGWSARALDGSGQPPLMIAMSRQNFGAMEALIPLSDLSHKNNNGLDIVEGAQWLKQERGESGALDKLNSYFERQALRELLEAEMPPQPAAPKARSL